MSQLVKFVIINVVGIPQLLNKCVCLLHGYIHSRFPFHRSTRFSVPLVSTILSQMASGFYGTFCLFLEEERNMYAVSKQFSFSASHQLLHLPDGHPCKRLHGHNYDVELVLRRGELDERGFVVDYNDMKPFKQYLDDMFDHRHINDILGELYPTAENIAKHLYGIALAMFHDVAITVRVSETPKTVAEYSEL